MLGKSVMTKWTALIACIVLLASCGGGGGGGESGGGGSADSFSITTTNPVSSTKTFVESGTDPMINAKITTSGTVSTTIGMCSGVVGTSCTDRSIYIYKSSGSKR